MTRGPSGDETGAEAAEGVAAKTRRFPVALGSVVVTAKEAGRISPLPDAGAEGHGRGEGSRKEQTVMTGPILGERTCAAPWNEKAGVSEPSPYGAP